MSEILAIVLLIAAQWLVSAIVIGTVLALLLRLNAGSAALYGLMIASIPVILEIGYYFGLGVALGVIGCFIAFVYIWTKDIRKRRKK